jgi:cellobiose phosphorylase
MSKPRDKKENKDAGWWRFTGEDETFQAQDPDQLSRLYFPLCNDAGMLAAITPKLHGDIKTGLNSFLTLPVSTEDLHNTRSARNFWVRVEGKEPWSATGSSAAQEIQRFRSQEKSRVEAGALWHRMVRENKSLGLRAETLNFIPASTETVEVMVVKITNTGKKAIRISPTAAIPIFGRSADNLRDHRHVTSLLHRVLRHDHGVLVKPEMSFDERGHRINALVYGVLGAEENGDAPLGTFPTVTSFIGEGGSLAAPAAVYQDLDLPELSEVQLQGREAMGALRFKSRKLEPGKTAAYVLLLGIGPDKKAADGWLKAYGSLEHAEQAWEENKKFWKARLDRLQVKTDDPDFNRWVRWVSLQPVLRKIWGNSFLPDFDYGRGGRGWRDLWQDCLALLLLDPSSARDQLLNNFGGFRMNGTNATIIGKKPGEFIADRNNISRVWMDHGVWPFMTVELYLNQSADWGLLLQDVPYFWDQDKALTAAAESGTVLEHLLVPHLTAYFNLGEHGNCRLEDADWNDGLDMAHDRGESVAFTAVYAGNLQRMAQMVRVFAEKRGVSEVTLAEELQDLLESNGKTTELSPADKQQRLKTYRQRTLSGVSGRKVRLSILELAKDLDAKGEALAAHVRSQEWMDAKSGLGWFNGYYDNNGDRVEGLLNSGVRMTLTGQVFPILSGVASDEQVQRAFIATKRYLQDRKLGGFRLNTNFGDTPPPLGRAFAFAYGEKENGAFFSHMVVMFAYGLYSRGFVSEGHEVLSSLYDMCRHAEVAKIYPGIPEYFNGEGRGLYHYLTGSASWYLLTLVTQVLGIRGEWGDLKLAPKLVPEQFGKSGQVIAHTSFAGKKLNITYFNRGKKPYGKYHIDSVLLHGRSFPVPAEKSGAILIPRATLESLPGSTLDITVSLA